MSCSEMDRIVEESVPRTASEDAMKLISFFTYFVYGIAILVALWPVVGLAIDPGDRNHWVRFIFCPLVALGIAAVGKLFSLICQALSIYLERNIRTQ